MFPLEAEEVSTMLVPSQITAFPFGEIVGVGGVVPTSTTIGELVAEQPFPSV